MGVSTPRHLLDHFGHFLRKKWRFGRSFGGGFLEPFFGEVQEFGVLYFFLSKLAKSFATESDRALVVATKP